MRISDYGHQIYIQTYKQGDGYQDFRIKLTKLLYEEICNKHREFITQTWPIIHGKTYTSKRWWHDQELEWYFRFSDYGAKPFNILQALIKEHREFPEY